jgi:hypothetical protein
MSWTMVQSSKDNGPNTALDTDVAFKSGKMAQNMKATGATTWPTAKED